MRKPGELGCLFCFVSGHDFSRAINAQKKCGFRVCVRTPEFGKPEGRTTDPSAPLRSGQDDNSSWKLYLAFPSKIVIPTGAEGSAVRPSGFSNSGVLTQTR